MNFDELQLSPLLLKALDQKGYIKPSPIQEQAIPYVLNGQDLLGCAQTGTGKTAAFALPIIQNLMERPKNRQKKKPVRALILTPTRELALQIHENIEEYGAGTPINSAVIFGGVSAKPQIQSLRRGIDILVATPGRLLDLIGQHEIDLSFVEIFVLDEADRMLDMGFIHDVKRVITLLPKKRQTLLFSATMPDEIQALTAKLLHNPVKVEVTPVSSTVDLIETSLYYVDKANKWPLLVHLLEHEDVSSTLVFTRTKHGADRGAKYLNKSGITAAAIHGDKSQGARQTALSNFKSGRLRVLVATDIAARGIDIEELSCVINFDLPNVPETYVHRIGRTGRAGLGGRAISFSDIEEKAYVKDIEKLTGKTIQVIGDHPYPMEVFEIAPKEERNSRQAKGAGKGAGSRRAKDSRRATDSKRATDSRRAKDSRRATDSRRDTDSKRATDSRWAADSRQATDSRTAADSRRAKASRTATDSRQATDSRTVADSRRATASRKQTSAGKPALTQSQPATQKTRPSGKRSHAPAPLPRRSSQMAIRTLHSK